MLEGEAVVDAKVAIYDPQSAFGAVAFRANGSKAERLAIVLNRSEAAAISGLKDARQAGAWVLTEEAAEAVVLKMGPAGALVRTAAGAPGVTLSRTDRGWKPGAGGVLSSTISHQVGLNGKDAVRG